MGGIINLLLFCLGISVGSFLNVLIDRLPRRESVFKGRSYCEACKKRLAWFDLIPVLSFVFLRGKCRFCRSSLSYYYPLVEFLTGVLFVATLLFILGNNFQFSIFNFQSNSNIQLQKVLALVYYLFIVSSLIVVFFTDLKYGIIPDKIIVFSSLVSLLYSFLNLKSLFVNHLLAGVGAFLFFLLLYLITRQKGIGFGDVKLAFLIGLILGFPALLISLYVAFLTGAVVGVILVLWGKKRFLGGKIPFGPFLVLGTISGIFWEKTILSLLHSLSFW